MNNLCYHNRIEKGFTPDETILSMIDRENSYYEAKIGKDLVGILKEIPDGCYVRYTSETIDNLNNFDVLYEVEYKPVERYVINMPVFRDSVWNPPKSETSIEELFRNLGKLVVLPFKIFGL